MNNIEHIIFDLDGTLIDSADSLVNCFERVLKLNSIQPIVSIDKNIIGPPLLETLTNITGSKDVELLKKLSHDFKLSYDNIGYKATTIYPGITNILNFLFKSHTDLYIVTNKRIEPTRKIINYLSWNHYFKGIYSLDAFNPSFKSKDEVLRKVINIHAIPIDKAIYVGDRSEDEKAASDCGLNFLGVNWGCGNWDSSKNTNIITKQKDLQKLISPPKKGFK